MKKALLSLMAAALVSSALAETKVAYSWTSAPSLDDEGKQVGIVTEVGGKIVYTNGDGERVNYLQGNYFTVCLNGKKGNLNDTEASANAGHMVLTLDEALKEGDKITMTGFRNKNAEGKNASVYMLLENGTEFAGVEGGSHWTNIYADDTNADYDGDGSNPSSYTWTVPAAEAGTKVIKMTRNDGGTNLFITNIVVETEAAAEAAEYATVTVDDSNLVKLVSGATREEINLNAGTGNLSAGEYMIQPAQRGYTLNKVELNGKAVATTYGYYAVELKADDKLVITAKYESDEVFYEIGAGYRNDITAAVKSIKQANGRDLTELLGNRGAANTGWEVSIDIDTENYRLDSIMVNGEKINGTSFVALESGMVEIYAEAYEVKHAYVVTNDPACATIETIGTNGNHAYTLHSETEVAFNGVTIKTLKITPAEGAQITVMNGETEVTAEYGEYRVDLVDSLTVTITNNVVAEYATATVDNSNKVKLTNENREDINLNAGTAQLSAGNYMIVPAQRGYTLNKVELNGKAVATTYGYYTVELKAGDKLNIVADYEADEVVYEIGSGYRNDITAAVKSISQANGRDLTSLLGNRGAANTGWEVNFEIDTENYQLDSIMVNGEKINGTSFVALEGGMIEIFATAIPEQTATLKVCHAADVTAELIAAVNEPIALVEGENVVKFNAKKPNLKLTVAEGLVVTVNGTVAAPEYDGTYTIALIEGAVIEVSEGQATGIAAIEAAQAGEAYGINGVRANAKGFVILNGKKAYIK